MTVVVLAALACADCSAHAKAHSAAEPASAPAPRAPAAGRTIRIGDAPEGIVYDPATETVAVATRNPDQLELFDGSSLRLRKRVPLPGHARHLALGYGGSSVLVPAENADKLVQVALPSGRVELTATVGKSPHDAAQGVDGRIVVGNEFGSSLSILGAAGTVQRTTGPVQQPGGVIVVGSTTFVVDVRAYTASTFDAATGKRTAVASAGSGPTHAVSAVSGQAAVTDTRGNALLIYRVAPLKKIGELTLPGTPYGITADATTHLVWVTLTALDEVVGIDVSTPEPKVVARYPTVQQPNTVTVDPGSHDLWITGTADGQLEHITR